MSVLTATISSKGKVLPADLQLLSIDVTREYNRIPTAELQYIDGNPATLEFDLSDSTYFEVGNEIEIRLKYEGLASEEASVFKGVVISHGLQMSATGCVLQVTLSDIGVKMTSVRKSAVYSEMADSDVIGKLLTQNGIDKESSVETAVVHQRLVQYYATDWDFMLCRAEANGLMVALTDGIASTFKPEIGGAVQTFKFGVDEIYSFDFEADARNQHKVISGSSWDPAAQLLTEPVEAEPIELPQAKLNAAAIYEVMGEDPQTFVTGTVLSDQEAKAWSDAGMAKQRMSMLRGRIRISGDGTLKIGDTVELTGISKLFSGKTLITGIRHQVEGGDWYTDLQFGVSADWFSASPAVADTKAAGLLPGVNGLQIGVVEAFEEDPAKEFRVKVKIPSINNAENTLWARIAITDAGKEHGMVFMPEEKDEVILGFLNDDPRQPVILGSLYSSANAITIPPTADNFVKGITTKTGVKLLFDDEKKMITLSTSDDQHVIINETDKLIELKDANGNTVKLSADGISIDSAKDLVIKSAGDIKMEASGKVEIKGSETDII